MNPKNDIKLAETLLGAQYDLTGSASPLPGENSNYLIETPDGARFVLKIAGDELPSAMLEVEHRAVERIHSAGVDLMLPRLVMTSSGAMEAVRERPGGERARARLLEYVPGTPWCDAGLATDERLEQLGRTLASMDEACLLYTSDAADD